MDHEEHRVSRRVALAGFVGLGALLAACGQGGETAPSGGPAAAGTGTPAASGTPTGTGTPSGAATGAGGGLFDGANTCVLTPEATEGPYYFDAERVRGDIREDRRGTRLDVAIRVQDSETCRPIPNAVVEIWHCDAAGVYSGFAERSLGDGAGGGGGDAGATGSGRFLRGAQVTDAEGVVRFTTVYPGFYQGRCVHIHAMVHLDDTKVLTTQTMFPEDVNDVVFAAAPYTGRGERVRNSDDSIFRDAMLMKMSRTGDGHLGVINFAVDSDGNRR